MKKFFHVKTLVATAIGTALFFVLGHFVSIPTGIPDTYISIQYGLLAFIAAVFGPVAGFLSGFIGHILSDLAWGSVWISWELASGIFGLVVGLVANRINLNDGTFTWKEALIFNIAQVIGHLICWVVVAPVLDIVIYAEPSNKVFIQGLTAAGANIVTTAVVGTLLCLAYAKARPQKGSLKEEE